MNEISKLYENAGIKKINTHQSEINNGDPRFTGISHSDSYIKYRQTLQEIKEIAENAYENESEYQATGVYNEIIQKITEAEEE